MKVVCFSLTGNCQKFLNYCAIPSENIIFLKPQTIIKDPYILITPTVGFGQIPETVQHFLEINHIYLKGVISSGNRNWGPNFALAGDIISKSYNVPVLMKIELLGNKQDYENFNKIYQEMTEKYGK